ncbi:ribosome silencing factor [Pseudoclavibacter chungangensis]|uniref:Ribosomal silencing factor RsfS n=1 Tax=Pseudoclavibacter chungangensis TaxID=587635 RepID=A0A7J5BRD4_9MICO|nr:ribosome silencing factor [Pseudoclavibacter chungangensis]KAB1656784.1 ribosome silencing factor [Pseudoclavibacter chungangensis]NYJ67230.1 ribosome-associated protein [Pseudoclavibacter chungangensis]
MTATPRALELTRVAAEAADAKQGSDLVALDVSATMPLTDVFLLATGRNERMVLSIAEEIEDRLQQELGQKAIRREGRDEGRWVLLDFGDLVVHVFHEEDRMYYGLERIWRDAPSIPLEVEGAAAQAEDSAPVQD